MEVGDLVEITTGKEAGMRGVIRAIGSVANSSLKEYHEEGQHIWSEWDHYWDGKLLAYPEGSLTWIAQKNVVLIESAVKGKVKEFRNIELGEEE